MFVNASVGSLWELQLPPTDQKNIRIRSTGYSKLPLDMSVSMNGLLSMWPCDGLVTCLG